MEIKPIPPETVRLAARGMQREVEKLARLERLAARMMIGPALEAVISRLARL